MRTILKIIAAPFVLALILIVAVLTFLSCVAGAVCIVACVGLSLLAILCLLAGQTVGCIAMFVLAFLVSPFGLPALGGWLVERLHGVKYAAMDFMAGFSPADGFLPDHPEYVVRQNGKFEYQFIGVKLP